MDKPKKNHIPEVQNMVETDYKSKCCDAEVVKYDASGGHKHWLGHQCTKCGNQAPLTTDDLLKEMGFKK